MAEPAAKRAKVTPAARTPFATTMGEFDDIKDRVLHVYAMTHSWTIYVTKSTVFASRGDVLKKVHEFPEHRDRTRFAGRNPRGEPVFEVRTELDVFGSYATQDSVALFMVLPDGSDFGVSDKSYSEIVHSLSYKKAGFIQDANPADIQAAVETGIVHCYHSECYDGAGIETSIGWFMIGGTRPESGQEFVSVNPEAIVSFTASSIKIYNFTTCEFDETDATPEDVAGLRRMSPLHEKYAVVRNPDNSITIFFLRYGVPGKTRPLYTKKISSRPVSAFPH